MNRWIAVSVAVVSVGLATCRVCAQAATTSIDEVKALITEAVGNYGRMLEQDFRVKMTSPELQQVLGEKVAQATGGMPVAISHMFLEYTNGKGKLKAPSIHPAFQQQIDQMVASSFVGKTVPQFTYQSIQEGLKTALAQAKLEIMKETDDHIDVKVSEIPDAVVAGKKVTMVQFRLEKKRKLATVVKLSFEGGKYALMKVEYGPVTIPNQNLTLHMQKKNTVKQNAFINASDMTLPEQFTIGYSNYKFR